MMRAREALYIGLFDSLPLLRDPMLMILLSLISFLPVLFIFVFNLRLWSVAPRPPVDRPQPHGGETCVLLKAGRIGSLKDHVKGFLGDSGPNVLKVFLQHDLFAAGLFDAGVSREDFQGRSQAGKDRIGADYSFCSQARHPFVNALGKLRQYVAPITSRIRHGNRVILDASAAHKVDR